MSTVVGREGDVVIMATGVPLAICKAPRESPAGHQNTPVILTHYSPNVCERHMGEMRGEIQTE